MLYITTCLWDANEKSEKFSRCYDESWVEKLYRGFARNLTRPFQFVVFTDKPRKFREEAISQKPLIATKPHYGCCIEPFRLNEAMIFAGLDTLIVSNIDHFADYCLNASKIAVPRDPYDATRSINGVVLSPADQRHVFSQWRGENDMEWMRGQNTVFIDDLWPGEVLSLKAHDVRRKGLQGAKIVYMHGRPKQNELGQFDFVRDHWR